MYGPEGWALLAGKGLLAFGLAGRLGWQVSSAENAECWCVCGPGAGFLCRQVKTEGQGRGDLAFGVWAASGNAVVARFENPGVFQGGKQVGRGSRKAAAQRFKQCKWISFGQYAPGRSGASRQAPQQRGKGGGLPGD